MSIEREQKRQQRELEERYSDRMQHDQYWKDLEQHHYIAISATPQQEEKYLGEELIELQHLKAKFRKD